MSNSMTIKELIAILNQYNDTDIVTLYGSAGDNFGYAILTVDTDTNSTDIMETDF